MTALNLLVFGNVSQAPYCNNLFPPLRALQRVFRATLVEPLAFPDFTSTGGATPALIPDEAVIAHTDPPPQAVVCLGGALHFSPRALRIFLKETVVAGFALSDPYGLDASITIAPQFNLFYTQDPLCLSDYRARGIEARRCDPATDPELYRPQRVAPECDILYYGKWTPYRNDLLAALAERFRVRVHAYEGETRWSVPTLPPLVTPDALCAALNRTRLALETALVDDVYGKHRGTFRITPRAFFAASCGVPTLVESFRELPEFFEPGVEIAVFPEKDAVADAAARLLEDEPARTAMGRRARQRALREHTWDRRAEAFLLDVNRWRARPGPRSSR
ncbi:MAG: glycosyltransferase [Thermoanaerobaculia bacterium]